jgi:hypothetical protein
MKLAFVLVLFSLNLNASQVVSPSAVEGIMTFRSTVFMPKTFVPSNIKDPGLVLPALIYEQTKHLMGVFEQGQFAKLNQFPDNDHLGSLGLGTLIGYQLVSKVDRADGAGWEITYVARHRILIRNDVATDGSDFNITIEMPHNPVEFYVKACTDKEYFQKEYLFYYWNPFDALCKSFLTGPQNSVDTINAHIHPLVRPQPNSAPDYAALKRQIIQNKSLRIALLFGFDISSVNPGDEGRESYERFQRYFENLNFVIKRQNNRSSPDIEYFRPATNNRFAVSVLMSASTSDQNSPITFAKRARLAFEQADIVMYIGHSGLGGNLNLDMITRLSSNDRNNPTPIKFPNAYQIYYLDSCGSFFFYSEEYALARRGIHNVDIITNGTSSYFWTQNSEVWHFVDAFIKPQKENKAWLDILTSVETQERSNFSYLVNVGSVR